MQDQVLSGMRVIEGSAFVAAPLGGMTLAQLGADVIRFDPIGGAVDIGRWPLAPNGQSLYWAGLNKGKRSISIDLRSEAGREIAVELITAPGDGAGLFLTNLPARGDFAFEQLSGRRSDLVMLVLGGDPDGTSQLDYTVNAATGFPEATGPRNLADPVNHVLPAWDVAAGLTAAVGLLAADRHRARTGKGQLIELALSDVAFATVAALGRLANAQLGGPDQEPDDTHVYGSFGHDFQTRDGRRVMVVALTPRQWATLCQATGIAELVPVIERATGHDLATEGGRYAARHLLVEVLRPWFAARDLGDVEAALRAAGASFGTYRTFSQLLAEDPRVSPANPMFADLDHPGVGRHRMAASPLRFAGRPRPIRRSPRLGEHTDEILAEVLGRSSGAIGRLHDQGIVAGPIQ